MSETPTIQRDADTAVETLERATDQVRDGALFDRSQYEREGLAIKNVDGNAIDRIGLKFGGTITLDRSNEDDVALYNRLRLGQDVTLRVEARCAGTGAKEKADADGHLELVLGEKALRVHTVYVWDGESD